MKWISYNNLFFVFIFLNCHLALSREWLEAYSNARSNGMGGTKVAVGSDDTSIYRNPASLGSFRGGYITFLDPEIETSTAFQSVFSSSLTNIQKIKDELLKSPNSYYHAKLQLTPTFTVRKFSFGLIYKNEVSSFLDSNLVNMDTQLQNDIGASVSYTQSLFDGFFKIGATAKMINRVEVDNLALPVTGNLDLPNIGSEGSALGFDAAIQLQAPVSYFPTLAIVARDVGGLNFNDPLIKNLNSSNRPNKVLQSIDAGLSFTTIHSKAFRTLYSFEYADLSNSRLDEFSNKRIHVGVETNWNDIFYFRLGMNQMYATAGFEIATEKMSWQISTYGEEVGTQLDPKEDRRISTKFILRL